MLPISVAVVAPPCCRRCHRTDHSVSLLANQSASRQSASRQSASRRAGAGGYASVAHTCGWPTESTAHDDGGVSRDLDSSLLLHRNKINSSMRPGAIIRVVVNGGPSSSCPGRSRARHCPHPGHAVCRNCARALSANVRDTSSRRRTRAISPARSASAFTVFGSRCRGSIRTATSITQSMNISHNE